MQIRATASAEIDAPAERIYSILADYRQGHPSILPARAFSNLAVDRGGIGAGTVIHFDMRVLGQTGRVRAEITEPVPGRTLVETYPETGAVTTFGVSPSTRPGATTVTIATEWTATGVSAWIERLLAPLVLRRLYREELGNLAREAATPR